MVADEPIWTVKGRTGQIAWFEDRVQISHRGAVGFLTHPMSGTKDIFLSEIAGVTFDDANWLTNGHLQILMKGHTPPKDWAYDDNAVAFTRGQRKEFRRAYEQIMERLRARQT
jgi:hypothetical protein